MDFLKKSLFAVVATFLLLNFVSCEKTKQNSEKSLDWAGIYTGVTPSASGMGINVRVTLDADETYTVEYQYVGKSDEIFTNTGTFTWNPEGDTVILDSAGEGSFPSYYKLGENALIQLDLEGNIITGELADLYILSKQE